MVKKKQAFLPCTFWFFHRCLLICYCKTIIHQKLRSKTTPFCTQMYKEFTARFENSWRMKPENYTGQFHWFPKFRMFPNKSACSIVIFGSVSIGLIKKGFIDSSTKLFLGYTYVIVSPNRIPNHLANHPCIWWAGVGATNESNSINHCILQSSLKFEPLNH